MKSRIFFIAYQNGKEMTPRSKDGYIVTYPDRDEAKDAAGTLGVAAAVNAERLKEIAKRFGLKISPSDSIMM